MELGFSWTLCWTIGSSFPCNNCFLCSSITNIDLGVFARQMFQIFPFFERQRESVYQVPSRGSLTNGSNTQVWARKKSGDPDWLQLRPVGDRSPQAAQLRQPTAKEGATELQ